MIHDLKPYPAYKDSGVPWLGKVPEHWEVLPNRALFEEVKERDCPDEQLLSVTISQGVIQQTDLLTNSSKKDSSNEDKTKYKLVNPGDIAYNKMRAWQGAVGVSKYRGIVSPAYVVVHPRDTQNPNYFHYLLRTPAFAKEAERWSYGITSDQWSLRPEHFKMIYCSLPPKEEQSAIVHYLDHFDRRIRHYIRAKKKLIKLLEEQKQAIIHQAVTRGLDPNVKLKPSGVEWLGNIPEHWDIISLGAASELIQTGPFGSQLHSYEYIEGGVPVINPSHMQNGSIVPDVSISISQSKADSLQRHKLQSGDIVAARRGELGRCALVTTIEEGWICGTGSLRICCKKSVFCPEYFLQLFSSQGIRDSLSTSSIGATMDNLNSEMVSRLRLPLPSLDEQHRIVELINLENKKNDLAISAVKQEISLLREYRTRLISDVVTGKLDMREAAANLSDKSDEMEVEDDFEEETIEESLEEIVTEEMVEGEL